VTVLDSLSLNSAIQSIVVSNSVPIAPLPVLENTHPEFSIANQPLTWLLSADLTNSKQSFDTKKKKQFLIELAE
jgi:hypothetical protein